MEALQKGGKGELLVQEALILDSSAVILGFDAFKALGGVRWEKNGSSSISPRKKLIG